ncbi:hypothetical protein [Pedobacter aquatilis]|uniref:hypothetical protein n=1 Tax=Pedobacter aquatilis TaxID=351343 RepID=UPI00292E8ADC|nr:hypothetical protein [Pedobacter aquatilis]
MKIKVNIFNVILIFVFFVLLQSGCAQNSSKYHHDNESYKELKLKFDKKLVSHFPLNLSKTGDSHSTYSYTDRTKNDFSLLLYEYGVDKNESDSIRSKFEELAIEKYKSSDSCLLVVNPFETKETNFEHVMPDISTDLRNKNCLLSKLPVPNFVNYNEYNNSRPLRLDNSFVIYVVESKKDNNISKSLDLKPDPQMPEQWENGYSRGIAFSEDKSIIIYWTVIW